MFWAAAQRSKFQLRTEKWDKAFTHCQGLTRGHLRPLSASKTGTIPFKG